MNPKKEGFDLSLEFLHADYTLMKADSLLHAVFFFSPNKTCFSTEERSVE